ncbi:MAG TPA: alpha-glucosidase C-terminal domain-containing protein, partial [Anaerolineae bacterium]
TEDQSILCVFNLSDEPAPLGLALPGNMVDLLSSEKAVIVSDANITLAAYAAHWLQLEESGG